VSDKYIKSSKNYCQAKTRKQEEAASWADSQLGCGNIAKWQTEDGHWVCGRHRDPAKRYGWNR
jgi:hypothetical protein